MKVFRSREFEKEICENYTGKGEGGMRGLAKKYRIDRRTVQRILVRNGIERKNSTLLKNVPQQLQLQIKRDLESGNFHEIELVFKYNISRKTIHSIKALFNITIIKVQNFDHLRHHFTEEQKNHILTTYGYSETLLSLSKIHNVSRSVIKKLLSENGKTLLQWEIPKKLRSRNKYLATIENEIIKLYLEDSLSIKDIKEKFKMSAEKVVEILTHYKVEIRPKQWYRKITFSDEEELQMVDLYKQNPAWEVADKFNISYPTLRNILVQRGVKIKPMGYPPDKNRNSYGISGWYNYFYFRSMNELSFILNFLEPKEISFHSGERREGIPYFDTELNKNRNYYPDFITDSYIYECKPKSKWKDTNTLDKAAAAREYAKNKNLKYRILDYPVFIHPIINKFLKKEIIFDEDKLPSFLRIYKKYLPN